MKRLMACLLVGGWFASASALADPPASSLEGRWQGVIEIPGRPVDATLDLQRKTTGEWIGSTDLAQLKARGVPLASIKVDGANVSADLADVLMGPGETKASYTAHLDSDGALHGEFHQAGHSAAFVLRSAGAAQVQLPRSRGSVPKALEGKWTGEFMGPGDYPRHVTITLSNPGRDGSQAQYVVVGKKTTEVPVSWVGYGDGFLQLESPIGVGYEGKLSADQRHINGTFLLGGNEFTLNLEHTP